MKELNTFSLVQEFGRDSHLYNKALFSLHPLCEGELQNSLQKNSFLSIITGELIRDKDKYLTMVYFRLVIETIIQKYIFEIAKQQNLDSTKRLFSAFFSSDEFISGYFIQINQELSPVNQEIINVLKIINDKLNNYSLNFCKTDLFGELYQNLVIKRSRHQTGEYFTPNWLVNSVVEEIWPEILNSYQKNHMVKILDPSCGSGSFLIAIAYRCIKERLFVTINNLMDSITGFDINPFSLFMIKANFFLLLIFNFDLNSNKNLEFNFTSFHLFDTLIQKKKANSLLTYTDYKQENPWSNEFDIIIGNPPWITLRSIKNNDYQKKIKEEFFNYNLINKNETHLFTQLEIASLFYCKSIDLYLKNNGLISFVMPKSVILGTKHNYKFQRFENPKSKLLKIWDLQNISKLFGMPSCVIFCKKGLKTTYPVDLITITDESTLYNEENSSIKNLNVKIDYTPIETIGTVSYYYDKFVVGASIFPRNLYFINIQDETTDGFRIKTDIEVNQQSKNQWKNISIEGIVAKKYMFCTLLAWELVPFGYTRLRLVVLPIKIAEKNKIILVDKHEIDELSSKWFELTNDYWTRLNTEKSKTRFPSLATRLNYNNLLIKQQLKRFILLYSGTGTNIACCVMDRTEILSTNQNSFHFISDVKTWIFETDIREEAHYLCAILNSEYLNQAIKPLQPQGLGGARAIHRRPLQFNIQQYNKTNSDHNNLAKLSIEAHSTIKNEIKENKIHTRKDARKGVSTNLLEINNITKIILEQ